MLELSRLLAFAGAAFVIIVVPGPSVLFVISRGVALGRRAALATVLGNALGAFCVGTLVAFGLGPLVTRSVWLYNGIKLLGAGYLLWLGWCAFRDRRELAMLPDAATEPKGVQRIIREGFVVGITNPKVVVFFSAILPQFVDRGRGSATAQMLVLLVIFTTIALVSDGLWGILAGSVRRWFLADARRLRAVVGTGGIAIMGLGARLALTRRAE